MGKTLVIYHGGCLDGVAAAACVGESLGWELCDFWAGFHDGGPTPDVRDRNVVIVDYSFPNPIMGDVLAAARSVILLDHHVSAIRRLEPLRELFLHLELDESRSGAGLAFDCFLTDGDHDAAAAAILYIEDGDLWRWKLPRSREVYAGLQAWPRDDPKAFADKLFREPWPGFEQLAAHGAALIAARNSRIKRELSIAWTADFLRHLAAVAPIGDPADRSDLGEQLLQHCPEAELSLVWWLASPGKIRVSMRSRPREVDVSALAMEMGGGGHRCAAGFVISAEVVGSNRDMREAFFGLDTA